MSQPTGRTPILKEIRMNGDPENELPEDDVLAPEPTPPVEEAEPDELEEDVEDSDDESDESDEESEDEKSSETGGSAA
jgi:hypothetical protein